MRENGLEDAGQLAAHRYDGLLALERVLLPGRVVTARMYAYPTIMLESVK